MTPSKYTLHYVSGQCFKHVMWISLGRGLRTANHSHEKPQIIFLDNPQ